MDISFFMYHISEVWIQQHLSKQQRNLFQIHAKDKSNVCFLLFFGFILDFGGPEGEVVSDELHNGG